MKKTCKTLLVSGALMMACALPVQAIISAPLT